jgi:hypothetical protein
LDCCKAGTHDQSENDGILNRCRPILVSDKPSQQFFESILHFGDSLYALRNECELALVFKGRLALRMEGVE